LLQNWIGVAFTRWATPIRERETDHSGFDEDAREQWRDYIPFRA